MSLSSKLRVKVPDIGHLQYLILFSFGRSQSRGFNDLVSDDRIPNDPASVSRSLRNLASKGMVKRPARGVYQILEPGRKAVRKTQDFYKSFA